MHIDRRDRGGKGEVVWKGVKDRNKVQKIGAVGEQVGINLKKAEWTTDLSQKITLKDEQQRKESGRDKRRGIVNRRKPQKKG